MAHADYSVTGGKLVIYMKKTLQLGEEKPYELPQQDKKPQFAMSIHSSSPAGLQLHPVLFGYLISLRTIALLSSLFKAGVQYIPTRPY